MQRGLGGEGPERPRGPVAQTAAGDQAVHDADDLPRPLRAEFHDAEVLAVGIVRVHLLRDVDDTAAADLDLHLFVAEGLPGLAIGEQEGVLVARAQQVVQKDGVEENVTI